MQTLKTNRENLYQQIQLWKRINLINVMKLPRFRQSLLDERTSVIPSNDKTRIHFKTRFGTMHPCINVTDVLSLHFRNISFFVNFTFIASFISCVLWVVTRLMNALILLSKHFNLHYGRPRFCFIFWCNQWRLAFLRKIKITLPSSVSYTGFS